jgi:ABC-type glutathione transport system ATPase component
MDNQITIETKNLIKNFGDFTAVNGVSFTVRQGEIFGFLGPNGSGKTTTIRMMLGLLSPPVRDPSRCWENLFQTISSASCLVLDICRSNSPSIRI